VGKDVNPVTQMAEILSIRALMKMHAFEHIPNEGVISSKDLAAKIGAEESLVGLSPSVSTSPSTVVDTSPPIRQSCYIYELTGIARLLRALVALGILQQNEKGEFAHTKNSKIYTSALGSFFQTM
jgi:hypothetical protein